MDFYISGDVAPGGRFKFSYISTHENATGKTVESDTIVPETDPTTEIGTNTVTDGTGTKVEIETQAENQGCGSVINVSLAVMTASLAAAYVFKKKH